MDHTAALRVQSQGHHCQRNRTQTDTRRALQSEGVSASGMLRLGERLKHTETRLERKMGALNAVRYGLNFT